MGCVDRPQVVAVDLDVTQLAIRVGRATRLDRARSRVEAQQCSADGDGEARSGVNRCHPYPTGDVDGTDGERGPVDVGELDGRPLPPRPHTVGRCGEPLDTPELDLPAG